jgi:Cu(I)/Ag(I) efflux system membrane protein CusA/SilA
MRLLLTRVKDFSFRPKWLARATSALLVGKIRSEEEHPISKPMMKIYQPVVEFSLNHKWVPITVALLLMAITIPVYNKLGSEFMPPLDEGTLLYMPTTTPGISVGEASMLLREQDRILRGFPQVQSVFGKAGRVESATDPAPFSMMETVVVLKPREQWPECERWYSRRLPGWSHAALQHIWPDRQETSELIYGVGGLNEALTMPGVTNAWTMPIKGRIDMLTTGIRTPLGIKVLGSNLEEIERIGHDVEQTLHGVPGTASVYAERTTGGYFLDFTLKRDALARYGLTVDDAESVLMTAVGGQTATTTVEGRERYAVSVRYQRGYRSDLQSLERVLVQIPGGAQVPLGELATLSMRSGPGMIRDENGRLSGYVFVDVAGRDLGSYVAEAQRAVESKVSVPTGYRLVWSGQYEAMLRVRERMKVVLPVTIFAVFLLLYANTGSVAKTCIILLAVPFSAIGAIWLLHWMGYNMSVAVWVGLIALLGVDAETAVFMLLYLDLSCAEAAARGKLSSWSQLREAIEHGAVKRLRPKVMTVACMIFGLLPILWSNGAGADVMKRIAVPLVGGIITSFLMELVVYPPLFAIWKWNWEVQPAIRRGSTRSGEGLDLVHTTNEF